MNEENETLRWPTNLDREAIVRRLGEVRETARGSGPPELVKILLGVEGMTSAQIGAAVIAAINTVQEKPEYSAMATQLAMVAMNLRNLK